MCEETDFQMLRCALKKCNRVNVKRVTRWSQEGGGRAAITILWLRCFAKELTFETSHKWQGASLMAQTVKNLPAMQETWVRSLGWEDPWRRTKQPTPVFLPGGSPWTEEPGRLQSMGSQRVGCD